MAPAHAIQFVILSGAGTSRSEASAESKDPYVLLAQQGRFRGTLPVHSVFFLAMITNSVDRGGGRRKSWRGGNRGRLFQEAGGRGHRRRAHEVFAHRAQDCTRAGRHASVAAAKTPANGRREPAAPGGAIISTCQHWMMSTESSVKHPRWPSSLKLNWATSSSLLKQLMRAY